MNRPSGKALQLGDELFDHVTYGMTQFNAIQELAEMVDESNRALVEAVRSVLQEAQRNGGVPTAVSVAQLRQVFADYEPVVWPSNLPGQLAGIGTSVPVAKNYSSHCFQSAIGAATQIPVTSNSANI